MEEDLCRLPVAYPEGALDIATDEAPGEVIPDVSMGSPEGCLRADARNSLTLTLLQKMTCDGAAKPQPLDSFVLVPMDNLPHKSRTQCYIASNGHNTQCL